MMGVLLVEKENYFTSGLCVLTFQSEPHGGVTASALYERKAMIHAISNATDLSIELLLYQKKGILVVILLLR